MRLAGFRHRGLKRFYADDDVEGAARMADIEKAFGPDMDHLLRVQLAYDVAKVRQRARGITIERYVPPAA